MSECGWSCVPLPSACVYVYGCVCVCTSVRLKGYVHVWSCIIKNQRKDQPLATCERQSCSDVLCITDTTLLSDWPSLVKRRDLCCQYRNPIGRKVSWLTWRSLEFPKFPSSCEQEERCLWKKRVGVEKDKCPRCEQKKVNKPFYLCLHR